MVAARPSGTRALEFCKFDRVPLGPPPARRVDRPGGGVLTSDRSIRICRKLGQAGSRTYHTLVMSPLPLCRIPIRVQNGEYDDDIASAAAWPSAARRCLDGSDRCRDGGSGV